MSPRLHKTAEAAEILNVGIWTVTHERKAGRLHYRVIGKNSIRFSDDDLADYIESCAAVSEPRPNEAADVMHRTAAAKNRKRKAA